MRYSLVRVQYSETVCCKAGPSSNLGSATQIFPQPAESFCFKGGIYFWFFILMYVIQHCFIYRPSDSTVSEDAEIETRTVATLALTARRSNNLARSHPRTRLNLIHKLC